MRRIALTVWHASLILLVIWSLFTALVVAAEQFVTGWRAPGLIALGMIVALEAIITQRLVARERQRLEEQAGVRAIEFVVIVLLVRMWSLAAQGGPLIATLGPWLRDPLRFFSGRFAEYLLWTLGAWVIATLLTADVIAWDGDGQPGPLPDTSIEREQIQQEWGQSVARYDRRYVVITLITLFACAFALYDHGPASAPGATRVLLSVAAIAGLVAGLLLHSAGRLSELRRNWSADNIDVDAGISRRWGRSGLLLLLGLLLLAPLLSWIVTVAPPPPLVPIANALLFVMTMVVSLVILLVGLILSPLILLLSLFTGGSRTFIPQVPRLEAPQIAEPRGDRPLLPALIFWGCVLLLIGITLVRYLQSRSDLRDAMRRWRVVRWLSDLLGEWWSDARGWAGLAAAQIRRLARRRSRPPRVARPAGAQAQLRALYRRMRQAGSRRGIPVRPSQTPYEYGRELGQSLPVARDAVEGLTEAYVLAEYGPRPAGPAEIRQARRYWRRLQRWLLGRRGIRRQKAEGSKRGTGVRDWGSGGSG